MKVALPRGGPGSGDAPNTEVVGPDSESKPVEAGVDAPRVLSAKRMTSKREFSWDDLRFFLALVRAGNPHAAAKGMRTDHTTVRRRISALETALRTHLFNSHGGDYELSAEGDRLLKYAEEIESLAGRIEEEIADSDGAISGTVRVGAPEG